MSLGDTCVTVEFQGRKRPGYPVFPHSRNDIENGNLHIKTALSHYTKWSYLLQTFVGALIVPVHKKVFASDIVDRNMKFALTLHKALRIDMDGVAANLSKSGVLLHEPQRNVCLTSFLLFTSPYH